MDAQQGVIDFSLYLKSKKDVGNDTVGAASNGDVADGGDGGVSNGAGERDRSNMAAVLDQKNYIEEVNRHLK